MVQEEIRKGPWTEQEDLQLICFVGLFGERRWDFLAKVSGLNRTGKSCRLRWVNYLHPGLKRGRMTPQEERLILELHSQWGNRWSRIARKLPGRTDNEIKNYWRTHMRKKAQERKQAMPPTSMSSTSLPSPNNATLDSSLDTQMNREGGLHDEAGPAGILGREWSEEEVAKGYSMDQIWKEIDSLEGQIGIGISHDGYKEEECNFSCPLVISPLWDCCSDSLWRTEEEEIKIIIPNDEHLVSYFEHGRES